MKKTTKAFFNHNSAFCTLHSALTINYHIRENPSFERLSLLVYLLFIECLRK